MKYDGYSARDFANDLFFIRWVKKPDEESDRFWASFIEENPEYRSVIAEARELVELMKFSSDELSDEESNEMRDRLLSTLNSDRNEGKVRRLGSMHWPWRKLAAAVVVVGISLWWGLSFMEEPCDKCTFLGAGQMTRWEQKVSSVGQKSVLLLSDGTKVWLNEESRLSYAEDFNGCSTREVFLQGEAFFEVSHNPSMPFIVHTESIKIKVLGTSFNVRSYAGQRTIETTLVEGKVLIEQTDTRGNHIGDVELQPNQCAVFNKSSKVINVTEVNVANRTVWRLNELVFDGEPMDNVILQMERWFGVTIHVRNKGNLDCRLTARIRDESLEDVLKMLENTHRIRYSIEGENVFIEGELCE
ncbi:MAG TPA: FecR domain-containing protein [Cyclobacteriaceae bacterium]|nr:FecR domain-containing protein [Cyclobacteriaceae bacterium]